MIISNQPKLLFHGVEIVHTTYQSVKRYSKDLDIPIKFDVVPKVFYPEDSDSAFSIVMEAKIDVKDHFTLEIAAIGHFKLDGDITPEIRSSFINTNAPAIMFPYLRSFVSTFTSNVGISSGTLIIPPQFFRGDLETLEDDVQYEEE